jgi:hypothetical protein
MGKPEAYVIGEDVIGADVDSESMSVADTRRENSRKPASNPGPELLSIVRMGDGDVHWIVVAVGPDRRTVSIAPLKQGSKVGMKHGVSVSELWPYYGQLEKSARRESA